MVPRIEGPPETAAPAEATDIAKAGANTQGRRGASKTTNNTSRKHLATARTWIVDRFLRVVEVRA